MGFSRAEISEATGGLPLSGPDDLFCSGVCIDSRIVKPGDLFVALPGERYDGHDFVTAALAAGARAAVVARRIEVPDGVGLVLVPDTVKALGDLALYHRRRFALPVVAVTGSTGKTSTKEMIASIGNVSHRVAKTEGNQNNQIGLPLTLLRLTSRDEILVVEMGMRGTGQIAALAALALPTIGVVTNIGLTHLELLGSIEAIAAAKGELLAALSQEGRAVVNADDPHCVGLAKLSAAFSLTYGLENKADVRGVGVTLDRLSTRFSIIGPGYNEFEVELGVPGRHHVYNALAAAASAFALGYTPREIQEGLRNFRHDRGRGASLRAKAGWTVIDDTYNANPASMAAALHVLASTSRGGRKIAVLADMLELGPATVGEHRKLGKEAARTGLSMLATIGESAKDIGVGAASTGMAPELIRHYDVKCELIDDLRTFLRPGDTVLVKGSRGMRLEEVVESLIE